MHRLVFYILFLGMAITGCATRPESLHKVEQPEYIYLAERISTVTYRGDHFRCEEGMLPTYYFAKWADRKGVYYLGTTMVAWSTNEMIWPKVRLYHGGIYIPNDETQAPRLFHVVENWHYVADDINAYNAGSTSLRPTRISSDVCENAAEDVVGADVVKGMGSDSNGIKMYPPIGDAAVQQKIFDAIKE